MSITIQNQGRLRAEVYFFDTIGPTAAKEFIDQLAAFGGSRLEQIDVHVNSHGGNVEQGIAIYNLLRGHSARVVTKVFGIAASIASVIAMAGDERQMADNSWLLIHSPSFHPPAGGTREDFLKFARLLGDVEEQLTQIYVSRSRLTAVQARQMIVSETWLNAREALGYGLIDRITGESRIAACFGGLKPPEPKLSAGRQRHVMMSLLQQREYLEHRLRK